VLKRVFGLNERPASAPPDSIDAETKKRRRSSKRQSNLADIRMSSYLSGNQLVVSFEGGEERRWNLPAKNDKPGIRSVRDNAVAFAESQGATIGQQNAVKKALTESEYWLTK
jgi:hypothetical protein